MHASPKELIHKKGKNKIIDDLQQTFTTEGVGKSIGSIPFPSYEHIREKEARS